MAATATAIPQHQQQQPWVERYRPKSLEDVSHQTEVVATLQNAVETGRLPHLLLYGPPGSGKTSVALALCRQLWHPSQWRRRVLELNASDERGIAVVRDKIKHFASLAVGNSSNINKASNKKKTATAAAAASFFGQKKKAATSKTDNEDEDQHMQVEEQGKEEQEDAKKYPNPPFKVIILDEADTVTPDAQAALRRIIEAHSRVTRFILICNYVTRIIEPLASRCAKFRFQALPPASMKERLRCIAQAETLGEKDENAKTMILQEDVLDQVLEYSDGDMRRAVTTLQSVHTLAVGGGIATTKNGKGSFAIAELVGRTPPQMVDDLWMACASPDATFDTMQEAVCEFCASGFSAQLLLSALLPKLLQTPDAAAKEKSAGGGGTTNNNIFFLTEACKADIAIRMAEAEKNMIDGADEYLQLMTVCSLVQTGFQKSRSGSSSSSS